MARVPLGLQFPPTLVVPFPKCTARLLFCACARAQRGGYVLSLRRKAVLGRIAWRRNSCVLTPGFVRSIGYRNYRIYDLYPWGWSCGEGVKERVQRLGSCTAENAYAQCEDGDGVGLCRPGGR